MKRSRIGFSAVLLAAGVIVAACARKQEASEPSATEAPASADPAEAAPLENAPQKSVLPEPGAPAADRAGNRDGDLLEREEQRGKKELPSLEAASAELALAFSDLEQALALSVPDCTTAGQLRDRVCELAEHICRLAEGSSASSSQKLCGDGRGRCADARKRYEQSCATPP